MPTSPSRRLKSSGTSPSSRSSDAPAPARPTGGWWHRNQRTDDNALLQVPFFVSRGGRVGGWRRGVGTCGFLRWCRRQYTCAIFRGGWRDGLLRGECLSDFFIFEEVFRGSHAHTRESGPCCAHTQRTVQRVSCRSGHTLFCRDRGMTFISHSSGWQRHDARNTCTFHTSRPPRPALLPPALTISHVRRPDTVTITTRRVRRLEEKNRTTTAQKTSLLLVTTTHGGKFIPIPTTTQHSPRG